MKIVIISGLSGAGKSTALKILEDTGYYCVDNIPLSLIEQVIPIYQQNNFNKIAIGIDARTSHLLEQLPKALKMIQSQAYDIKMMYLEANTDCLVQRFSETRRKHPLSNEDRTIEESINYERELLSNLGHLSHRIDTSDLSANSLRAIVKQFVEASFNQMNIIVQSFGFKYGLPIDSDFVFDVRCLPNPHYNKEIKQFNGTQQPIIDFLAKETKVLKMRDDIYNMVNGWFTEFSNDNRNYLTIAIGCTGGKHRSVFLAEQIAQLISENFDYNVIIRHRQMSINDNA